MEKKDIEIRDLFIEIRKLKKLTQEEFGKTLKVSRSTIAKIENKEMYVSDKLVFYFISKYKNLLNPYNIHILKDEIQGNAKDGFITNFGKKIIIRLKDYFEEIEDDKDPLMIQQIDNPNTAFKKNMERLAFLERENEELKEKIRSQNDYIKNFLNKNL